MEEISLEAVKQRTVRGAAALFARGFLLQPIVLVAYSLLTVLLTVEQLGVFALVLAIKNFFSYFADVGLAAAIIQKRQVITQSELRSTFTVQQILVGLVVLIILFLTPLFKQWYGLSQASMYLLFALAFSLILGSLRAIPSSLLERELKFERFVIPQIVETILFNAIAVFLAWLGFGITSFTIAVLVSSIAALILVYILRPWMPGFAFSKESLGQLLRFGLPYQINNFLAVAKDDGMTLILGFIVGPAGVGLIGWAQKWSQAVLRQFMDPITKISFPAFSRLQEDKKTLSTVVSKSIGYICLAAFPILTSLIVLGGPLTEIIPRYEKWQPALFALFLMAIHAGIAAVTTPLTNMFNAIGKIYITFRLMVMWTVLTWVLVPFLAYRYHVNGAALGLFLVGLTSIVAWWWANKYVKITWLESVVQPLVSAVSMGLVMFVLGSLIPLNLMGIIIVGVVGVFTYMGASYVLSGQQIFADIKRAYGILRNR